MFLTEKSKLAVNILKHLNTTMVVNVERLSSNKGWSLSFTQQVALKLKKQGLINTKRGPNGGSVRIKHENSLYEVLQAVEPQYVTGNTNEEERIIEYLKYVVV